MRIESGCPVGNHSNKFSDDIALTKGELQISYRELNDRIDAAVLSLQREGVKPGMKVGIISENSIKYITMIFALLRMGSFAVPINFRFRYPEIEKIISGIGIDLVISEIFTNEMGLSRIRNIALRSINTDRINSNKYRESWNIEKGGIVILTSGSTGIPKGVLLSPENHFFSAVGANLNITLKVGDNWLLSLPLYHVGGLAILFRAFLAGASISLPNGKGKSLCEEIYDSCITHISMVATQLVEYVSSLESMKQPPPQTLEVALVGGGNIPELLIQKALSLNVPVYKTYGLTEMSSQVTATKESVSEEYLATSGSVLKYRELLIGAGNEILVRGKTLSPGYISGGKFTSLNTDADGWFHTGDIGSLGESGDLFLSGRKDNMFISGGENVFPEEIESELLKIENIAEAVVVSVENEKYGNRPVAFINTGGKKISREEIVKSLKISISGFKIPDKFYYLDNIEPGQVKRRRPFLKELAKHGKGLKTISD